MEQASVLIIEDDPNIRDLYADALEAGGMIVYKAKSGEEGVEMALKHHPSVILMDIMMPDINGHKATEKIRIDKWGRNAKIIFLTNMSDAGNVTEAVKARSEEYIIKVHTTPKEVVNIVRTASQV